MPAGPHTTRFSRRCTHSSVRSACWLGAGMLDRPGFQAAKVLPVGKPATARRVASAERSRPPTSSVSRARSVSTGSQRWARAVASTSGAIRRACGIRSRRSSASTSSGSGGAAGTPTTGAAVIAGPRACPGRPSRRCPGTASGPARRCGWARAGCGPGGPGSRPGRPRRTGR